MSTRLGKEKIMSQETQITSTPAAIELHTTGTQALVDYLLHHPCDLRDIRQLMHRFQLSAESCTRALQLWEEQTLATETSHA